MKKLSSLQGHQQVSATHPRTKPSTPGKPVPCRLPLDSKANTGNSLSTLLRSKEPTATDETQSPRRTTAQGPMGMETLSLVTPDELATRTSRSASSRASSSRSCTSSRPGKKSASRSKRAPRSSSKSRSKENGAQVYALWTAAITAGFLVGFGAGYAWKEYLTGRAGEDVRRVGCTWCGDGKR